MSEPDFDTIGRLKRNHPEPEHTVYLPPGVKMPPDVLKQFQDYATKYKTNLYLARIITDEMVERALLAHDKVTGARQGPYAEHDRRPVEVDAMRAALEAGLA